MFSNYLTIALRNLKRQPLYTFLTIAGLAIGIACCLLIVLYVNDELSYDQFHVNKNRIYRINTGMRGDGKATNMNGQIAAGPSLQREFPEIESYVRFRKFGWNEKRVVAYKDRRFYESGFLLADSTLFHIFTFPLIEGDPDRALVAPNSIVITRSIAKKYFGNEEPMGKRLLIDQNNDGKFIDFTVTGIADDPPSNSSIQFGLIGSMTSETQTFFPWSLEALFTFVLVRPGTNVAALQAKLPVFMQKQLGPRTPVSLHLQSLNDIRLYSPLHGKWTVPGDAKAIYILSAVAFLILLIASINFVNLSTARSARRAKEVGMRKVLGAQRRQLVRQFLGESVILTAVSVMVSLVLVEVLLPWFNGIADKDLSLFGHVTPVGIGFIVLLIVGVGTAAGGYPAYVLSAFRPLSVLRQSFTKGILGPALIRKGLVVLQFTISVTMMVCTAIVFSQMNLVRTMDLGFDREQVLVLPLNDEVRSVRDAMKNELEGNPGVLGVTLSEQVPGRAGNGMGYRYDDHERTGCYRMFVDEDFARTYKLDLIAGRDFSRDRSGDPDDAFIVNQSLLKAQGVTSPEDAIGKPFTMFHAGKEKHGTIIGVAKDFQIQSLHDRIEETVLTIMPVSKMNFVSIRIAPGNLSGTLAFIENVWKQESPDYPFNYYFVDQDFDLLHRADQRLGEVFGYFAVLAIIAACLGLFGLAAYASTQRTKELGIRKVLGASVPGLVGLLAREFLVLIGIAVLLSWPLAYFGMSKWLQNFAYHVSITPMPFLLAGLLGMIIAFGTIAYQTVAAARANPVDSLRYE